MKDQSSYCNFIFITIFVKKIIQCQITFRHILHLLQIFNFLINFINKITHMLPNFENQDIKLELINKMRVVPLIQYNSRPTAHDLTQGRHLYFC